MKKIIGLFVLVAMFSVYAIQSANIAYAEDLEDASWGEIKSKYRDRGNKDQG